MDVMSKMSPEILAQKENSTSPTPKKRSFVETFLEKLEKFMDE